VLVHYFGYIHGTLEEVARALNRSTGEMSAWAQMAYRQGEALYTSITPGMGIPAKEVELTVGSPTRNRGRVIVPLVWEATGPGAIFPTMEADLVLEPVGDGLVEVTLRGSYRPPLKGVGRLLDRALMHRLAEATAKSFLDRLCGAVQSRIGAEPAAAPVRPDSDGEDDAHRGALPGPAPDREVASGTLGPAPQAR
jgi:hypothetical protein